jgi:hypothetical protein
MAAIAIQSAAASDWPRTTRPVSAANTGLTLMNTPKNLAGTRRSASRSATIGTAEHSRPAVAARYPEVELQLIRTNSATGGLAEGLCDIAVLRTAVALATELYRRPS